MDYGCSPGIKKHEILFSFQIFLLDENLMRLNIFCLVCVSTGDTDKAVAVILTLVCQVPAISGQTRDSGHLARGHSFCLNMPGLSLNVSI